MRRRRGDAGTVSSARGPNSTQDGCKFQKLYQTASGILTRPTVPGGQHGRSSPSGSSDLGLRPLRAPLAPGPPSSPPPAMDAMKAKAKEMAQKALEEMDSQAAEKMPGMMKPFMLCNGGSAVRTMNCMACALPADAKEGAKTMYEKYMDTKKKIDDA